ncbi:toxin-antitoxin system HicB family antitoxin [Brachybacterium sp. J144]|uniref:toxin-antitoxin system HicB family antitoxin n=1 Tax=Brachybacterium sp. J144 TaxID=3116487 RepID=UPI002E7685E6|nr:toxin-antitoxin system HicB family antitoxin [Brachybacterium sp. J144]MEE1652178.1 toxin-antitoxin system HicB family antitoxin [Brachybacterium sp. J144]
MATKPANRYAARPRTDARSTGSAKDAFIDPSSQVADEISKLTIRLPKSLHKDVKASALTEDVSVQEWIQDAIKQKLARKTAS